MRKGVPSDNRLVRLDRHVHEVGDRAAQRIYSRSVDIGRESELPVGFQNHRNFLEGCVSCPFADAVDCDLALPCTVHYAGHRVGRGHSQIIVAMSGDYGLVDVRDIVAEIFDLRTIFRRKAIPGGIRNVDNGGPGIDNGLDHSRKVFIVSPSGILSIELHVVRELSRVTHRLHGALEDFLAVGVELVADMGVGRAYAGMDTAVLGIFQCLGGDFNILLHRPCQGADGRPGDRLRNLDDRVEITRAGDRETSLDNIHPKGLESLGDLDFLNRVELTPGHLLPVPQGSVEEIYAILFHKIS